VLEQFEQKSGSMVESDSEGVAKAEKKRLKKEKKSTKGSEEPEAKADKKNAKKEKKGKANGAVEAIDAVVDVAVKKRKRDKSEEKAHKNAKKGDGSKVRVRGHECLSLRASSGMRSSLRASRVHTHAIAPQSTRSWCQCVRTVPGRSRDGRAPHAAAL
jgi:hypothetical protein